MPVKTIHGAVLSLLVACNSLALIAGEIQQTEKPAEKTAIDLLSYEFDYGTKSDFREKGGRLGGQDFLYNNINYGHRFLITGNWFFRAGAKYERYDFGASFAPVPSKLQSVCGVLAVEYVEQNFAGAALELYPGAYFENQIRSDCFDIPWDLYSAFKIKEKKLYGIIGASGAMYDEVPVVPIIGVIWITSDNTRAELVFPKTSLIYTPSDNWDLRLVAELTGGGYRTGPNENRDLNRAVVQYWDGRATVQATYSGFKPLQIGLGVGYIFQRSFDYFRLHESFTTEGSAVVKVNIGAQF